MKPLPSAPATDEDSHIWWNVIWRFCAMNPLALEGHSFDADRRDAVLMLEAQQIARFGPAAIELYGIAFRGWNV